MWAAHRRHRTHKRPRIACRACYRLALTPRDALPWLDRTWRLERVDDVPVWSLSCFYVRKGCRKRGVTSALIAAALKAAKRANAAALEAYPLDADRTPSASSTGYASTFARAGFKITARRVPPRPILRHDLKAIARRASIAQPPNARRPSKGQR